MSTGFAEQVHLEPISEGGGSIYAEYIECHTYQPDSLGLLVVHGHNMDEHSVTVDMWVRADQVRALRDALNKMLGE